MPGHQHHALGAFGIGTLQDRINNGDDGGFGDAVRGRFGKGVGLDVQASAAISRVALELGFDPFARGADARRSKSGVRIDRIPIQSGLGNQSEAIGPR